MVTGVSDRRDLAAAPARVHRLRCNPADGAVGAGRIIQGKRSNQLIADRKQVLGLCRRNFIQPVGNPCPALGFDDPFVGCGREGVGRPVPGVRNVGEPLAVQPSGSVYLLVVDQAPHFLSVWQAPVALRGAVAEAAAAAGQAACCNERLCLRAFVAEAAPLFQPDQMGEQVGNGAIAIVDKTWVGPCHARLFVAIRAASVTGDGGAAGIPAGILTAFGDFQGDPLHGPDEFQLVFNVPADAAVVHVHAFGVVGIYRLGRGSPVPGAHDLVEGIW